MFLSGIVAWLVTRAARCSTAWRTSTWPPVPPGSEPLGAAAALERHPSSRSKRLGPGRARPACPDDDPEFLRMLDRLISGAPEPGE